MTVKEYLASIKSPYLKISFPLAAIYTQLLVMVGEKFSHLANSIDADNMFFSMLVTLAMGIGIWAYLGFVLLPIWALISSVKGDSRNSTFSGLLWFGMLGALFLINVIYAFFR